ncbi:hypothetical protein CMI37_33180 [Candidatus Pacearchaeota archaeon]|nr:hypothetical protein [Candidatus Pacearchaeota archaeon]|tara:strand:- start:179 stop:607 length:429 start_codon:yes stop_codon:yes gene_type:complete
MGAAYLSPFVDVTVDTDIMASGDALGAKNSFVVPRFGTIHSIVVRDAAKQSANLDVVFFAEDITGTATNAAFDPTDAELLTCIGAVLVDTWKAFNDNSLGSVDNVGLPFYAPASRIYFQCVTRGTPTYVAATDIQVRIGVIP